MAEQGSFEPIEALLFDLGGVVLTIDFRRCFRRWADIASCPVEDIVLGSASKAGRYAS